MYKISKFQVHGKTLRDHILEKTSINALEAYQTLLVSLLSVILSNFIVNMKEEPFLKRSEKMGRKRRSWWNISSSGSWKIVFHKQTHDKRWRICWFSGPKQQKPISADVSEIWNIGRLHYWVCDREWVSAFIQRRIVSFRYNNKIYLFCNQFTMNIDKLF